MSRNGLEKMNLCGRVIAGRKERRKQEEKEAPFEAFSTIELFLMSVTVPINNRERLRGPLEKKGSPST